MTLVVDIKKRIGSFLLQVQFESESLITALLGPSGCGKTMTLKCIAGIETPDSGKIVLHGVTLFDSEQGICLAPQKRNVGLMFQNYALFPNMTVLDNIRCGARRIRDAKERESVLRQVMQDFELSDIQHLYPGALSGGQKQLVALARMVASKPEAMLLDEPFAALDEHLKYKLEIVLKKHLQQFGRTVLFVSHNRDEVYRICESAAVMSGGKIMEYGDIHRIYENPKTRAGAELVGCKNISPVECAGDTTYRAVEWNILFEREEKRNFRYIGIPGEAITLEAIPNEKAASGAEPYDREGHKIRGRVCDIVENPDFVTLFIRIKTSENGQPLLVDIEKSRWREIALVDVMIQIHPEKVWFLDEDGV